MTANIDSRSYPLDYPWSVDGRGRTAATDRDGHVRDLVEQVLFTSPGERVMRPDFGCGLLGMVFEPGGPEVAAAARQGWRLLGKLRVHDRHRLLALERRRAGQEFERGAR